MLEHEDHHLRVRDPLRFACGRILSQALFFVPVLRPLGDRYGELAELQADDAAVRASAGQKAPLASALLGFEASGTPERRGHLTRAGRLAAREASPLAASVVPDDSLPGDPFQA